MDNHASAAHAAYLHGGHFATHVPVHQEHVYNPAHQHAYNYSNFPPGYGSPMYGYNPNMYSFPPAVVNPTAMASDAGVGDTASGMVPPAPAHDATQAAGMPYYFPGAMPGVLPGPTSAYAETPAPTTDGNGKPTKAKSSEKEEPPKKPMRAHLKQPKQAPSAWQIFFSEELASLRASMPGVRLNVAHASKGAGEKYNSLPAEEKAKYQEKSMQLKNQWEQDMRAWKESLSPEDIKLENAYRTQQRKAGKSRKSNLKDPHAPKKPMSAYFLFLRAIRASPEMKEKVFGQTEEMTKQSVLAALKWRELPENEKLPFVMKAEQDKVRYDEARKTYDGAMAQGVDPTVAAAQAHDAGLTAAGQMAASNATIQKLHAEGLPPGISFDVESKEFDNHASNGLGPRKTKKKSVPGSKAENKAVPLVQAQ